MCSADVHPGNGGDELPIDGVERGSSVTHPEWADLGSGDRDLVVDVLNVGNEVGPVRRSITNFVHEDLQHCADESIETFNHVLLRRMHSDENAAKIVVPAGAVEFKGVT